MAKRFMSPLEIDRFTRSGHLLSADEHVSVVWSCNGLTLILLTETTIGTHQASSSRGSQSSKSRFQDDASQHKRQRERRIRQAHGLAT